MEALGTDTKHGRCCVCMEKNKICNRNVNLLHIFQIKFDYEAGTKLFGTPNIIRMMKLAPREQKHLLASSILKEGAAWIGGGYGVI
ncbi:unnamed protein product [Brassica rapa subsp. trilocularis]